MKINFPVFGLGFSSIRGAFFFDVGGAWDEEYRETLGSIGAGVRVNFLNAITFRYDIGKKIEDNSAVFSEQTLPFGKPSGIVISCAATVRALVVRKHDFEAARRHGVYEVALPKTNDKNVKEDLSDELRRDMTIRLVSTIDEVVAIALGPPATVGESGRRM